MKYLIDPEKLNNPNAKICVLKFVPCTDKLCGPHYVPLYGVDI